MKHEHGPSNLQELKDGASHVLDDLGEMRRKPWRQQREGRRMLKMDERAHLAPNLDPECAMIGCFHWAYRDVVLGLLAIGM